MELCTVQLEIIQNLKKVPTNSGWSQYLSVSMGGEDSRLISRMYDLNSIAPFRPVFFPNKKFNVEIGIDNTDGKFNNYVRVFEHSSPGDKVIDFKIYEDGQGVLSAVK